MQWNPGKQNSDPFQDSATLHYKTRIKNGRPKAPVETTLIIINCLEAVIHTNFEPVIKRSTV